MTQNLGNLAQSFLKMVIAGKVHEAYEKYISPDFIHHNPYFKGDRTSLMEGMAEDARNNPNKVFDIKQTVAENDLVVVHSNLKMSPEDPGMATVHIFRFEGDKIVEQWGTHQSIPEDMVNEHGVF
jgi:predicted SnoaL-like aldol condensation-catalyzing enzyme